MHYMLDTNICIYLIKKHPQKVLQRLQMLDVADVCVWAITVAELAYGVEKSHHKERNRIALAEFLALLEIVVFSDQQAMVFGMIRTSLESKGTPIGPYDLQIAAHALSLDLTLITNSTKEFKRIPKLTLENWV
jgi:tRNA(fMet)-specific endonuclease VapC